MLAKLCVQRKKLNTCTHTHISGVCTENLETFTRNLSGTLKSRVGLKETGNFHLLLFCSENKISIYYVWSNTKEKNNQYFGKVANTRICYI